MKAGHFHLLTAVAAFCLTGARLHAEESHPTFHEMHFSCDVSVGPLLTNCVAKEAEGLAADKIDHLRRSIESTPPCGLPDVTVGSQVDIPKTYADEAYFWALPIAAPGKGVVSPDWAKQPSAEMLAKNFPPDAARQGISGSATIRCLVSVKGRLHGCTVKSEAPEGMNFGQAALNLAPDLRFTPKLVDCKPVDGGDVTLPIRFGLYGASEGL